MMLTSGLAALVCFAMSSFLVVAIHARAGDQRTEQTSATALRVIQLVKSDHLPRVLPSYSAKAIQVLNARGQVVAATQELTGKPPMAVFRSSGDVVRAKGTLCPPRGLTGCMTVISFRVLQPDGEWLVFAANDTVSWFVSPGFVGLCLGISVLLVALTAMGTSRTISRTLAPVGAIRAELAEITTTDTGRRVSIPERDDEIKELAETVNATLDRLEGSLKQLQRFTSDASHDLRSPITAIRARIEAALMDPDDADWPETAHRVLESLDRLQAIVTDLLTLARLDAGVPRDVDAIDLPGLVSAELQRSNRTKEVRTDLQPKVTVVGDRLRLNRLLTNLLDNAERHARSQIKVIVRAEHDVAVLEVQDDGTGIAPEHREVVFQRFARLEAARHKDVNGTGLGLPIAREIAKAHGGSLTIEDSKIGARFVLRIPIPSESPHAAAAAAATRRGQLVLEDVDQDLADDVILDGRVRLAGVGQREVVQGQARLLARPQRAGGDGFRHGGDGVFLGHVGHGVDEHELPADVGHEERPDGQCHLRAAVGGIGGHDAVRPDDRAVQAHVHRGRHLYDDVNAVGRRVPYRRRGVTGAVVDGVVRAGGGRQARLFRAAHGRHDRGARPAGQLDRRVADRAGAAGHEHRTARQRAGGEPLGAAVGDGEATVRGDGRDADARAEVEGGAVR
jgi:signal transduction histidine kinase